MQKRFFNGLPKHILRAIEGFFTTYRPSFYALSRDFLQAAELIFTRCGADSYPLQKQEKNARQGRGTSCTPSSDSPETRNARIGLVGPVRLVRVVRQARPVRPVGQVRQTQQTRPVRHTGFAPRQHSGTNAPQRHKNPQNTMTAKFFTLPGAPCSARGRYCMPRSVCTLPMSMTMRCGNFSFPTVAQ